MEPEQLEAIVYNSKEDNCFIAHCVECDKFGTENTKEQSIKDLERGLKNLFALCEKDKEISLYQETSPPEIKNTLKKAKANNYKPIIHQIQDYFKIYIYDFTKEKIFVE